MVTIIEADLRDEAQARAIIDLTAELAASDFGRREAMTQQERDLLIPALARFPAKYLLLAVDGSAFCGLAVCFVQLSTFSARETLKLHDLYVTPAYRRRGVGRELVRAALEHARQLRYAFVTLEVSTDNPGATSLFESLKFVDWLTPTKFLEVRL